MFAGFSQTGVALTVKGIGQMKRAETWGGYVTCLQTTEPIGGKVPGLAAAADREEWLSWAGTWGL